MDGIFYLKSSPPKGLLPNAKHVALDPVAMGFGCGGTDAYCSTAYSSMYSALGGAGNVLPTLRKKYGIDGRIAIVSFSAGHGFANPLLNNESPDAVLLLDSTFGGGKSGYIKAAKAAASGGPLLATVTSDKGTTDPLNNGDYAWREYVLKPAGVSLSTTSAESPMPTPAGGVSSAGNLWYYRYSHAQIPHTSMGKLTSDVINAHLIPYWGAKKNENLFWWGLGVGLVAVGAWWAWSNRARRLENPEPASSGRVSAFTRKQRRNLQEIR